MNSLPPLPASPLAIAKPVNSGIDLFSDKVEYKTITAQGLEYFNTAINKELQGGWKLYGNMVPIYIGGTYSRIEYNQTLIRKLPAKGGRRSSVRTRKAKLKSNPPHKSH